MQTVESVLDRVRFAANSVVVMGDSLVEDAKFPDSVCGIPLVNACIGGRRAATVLSTAEKILTKPALIVVSVGVNGNRRFAILYSLLLDSLPKTKIAVASLAQSAFEDIDKAIRDTAKILDIPVIDMGGIPNFETRDGIHPVEHSYIDWRQRLVDGIRETLDCK